MQEFHTPHTNSYKACLCAPANTACFADHAKNYTHINSNLCVLIMQTLHTHQQQHSSPLSLVCWSCTNYTHINSSTTHLCVSTNKAGFANTSIPNKHHLEQVLVVLHASVSISSCLTRINLDTCCTFPLPTSLHLDQVDGSETTH